MNDERVKIEPRPTEGIRSWYRTKTRKAIMGLVGATAVLILTAVMVWIFAPLAGLQHAQTFNGALVIPGFGGLWIASFMFIWLIPMREVSFRGQETMERMEERLEDTMQNKIAPAVETWQRVGDRFEKSVIPRFEKAIARIEQAAELIEKKLVPTIEVARRIEGSIEAELQTGLLRELRDAAQSVNLLVMTKGETPAPPPDLNRTLASLEKPGGASGGAR